MLMIGGCVKFGYKGQFLSVHPNMGAGNTGNSQSVLAEHSGTMVADLPIVKQQLLSERILIKGLFV